MSKEISHDVRENDEEVFGKPEKNREAPFPLTRAGSKMKRIKPCQIEPNDEKKA